MDKVGDAILELTQQLSTLSTNGYARIKINQNLCTPEEFERLFYYFRKGTLLEHIDVDVDSFEPKIECGCGYEETVNKTEDYMNCPSCGKFAEVQNHAFELVEPDPSKAGKRSSIRF